jgi:hypothetical protein
MTFAAVACSPVKDERVQPAIQRASGSSLPASIAPLASRNASAISVSETIPKPWALWWIRQVPSIAAAAAKAGSIANACLSMTIASRMLSSVYW